MQDKNISLFMILKNSL